MLPLSELSTKSTNEVWVTIKMECAPMHLISLPCMTLKAKYPGKNCNHAGFPEGCYKSSVPYLALMQYILFASKRGSAVRGQIDLEKSLHKCY
jgi:hypothetical protein